MRWGYKKGAENGKRKAANDIKYDQSGNKYKQLENGSFVFLDSRRNRRVPKANASGKQRNRFAKKSGGISVVRSSMSKKLSGFSSRATNIGKKVLTKWNIT